MKLSVDLSVMMIMVMVACCLIFPRNFLLLLELYGKNIILKHEGNHKKIKSSSDNNRELLGHLRHQTTITIKEKLSFIL